MLQAWLSIGYIVLFAILVLAFILWRRGGPVGHHCARGGYPPLGWMGICTSNLDNRSHRRNGIGRSNPDAGGNTTDIEYIYMRNPSDRGLELTNDDSWWWLRHSERVFNDAKTAHSATRK